MPRPHLGTLPLLLLSKVNLILEFKKSHNLSRQEVANFAVQPEPSWLSPAGAEVAQCKLRPCNYWGRDLVWWQPYGCPQHTKSTELLEITNFLSPTDVPWQDLAPPDAHMRIRTELFLMFHYTLCINIYPDWMCSVTQLCSSPYPCVCVDLNYMP